MSAWNIADLPVMVTCIFFKFRVWYGSYRKETLWWVYSCDIESSNEPEEWKVIYFQASERVEGVPIFTAVLLNCSFNQQENIPTPTPLSDGSLAYIFPYPSGNFFISVNFILLK